MIEDKELRILRNSILTVSAFTEQVHHINSAQDFIIIHNRNLEMINKIAKHRNSEYLKKKISEYPSLNVREVTEYIKMIKKDLSFFDICLGNIYSYSIRFLKTRSFTGKKIKLKMLKIKYLNKYALEVIEDPYMENVYRFMK